MVEVISLILSVVGLGIAVLALVVGFWHVFEIKQQVTKLEEQSVQAKTLIKELNDMRSEQATELGRQSDEARAHTQSLDTIRRELSTRYIGQFPRYLPEIVEVLDKAQKEIVILCDFPAYGAFSNPAAFLRYRSTLEQKLDEGKTVQLTCFDKNQRMRTTREQFLQTPWDEWRQNSENSDRLKRLLAGRNIQPDDISESQFIDLLEEDDMDMLKQSLRSADVIPVAVHIPLYFWLCDSSEAIFAITSLSKRAIEYGFRTVDPQLITALNEMRDHYRRLSQSPTPQLLSAPPITHP